MAADDEESQSYDESNNKVHAIANDAAKHHVSVTSYDLWALGITIVIGGQYFAWNAGLAMGFGSFMIGVFLIGLGYLCLTLCLAELAGSLPFGGWFALLFHPHFSVDTCVL